MLDFIQASLASHTDDGFLARLRELAAHRACNASERHDIAARLLSKFRRIGFSPARDGGTYACQVGVQVQLAESGVLARHFREWIL